MLGKERKLGERDRSHSQPRRCTTRLEIGGLGAHASALSALQEHVPSEVQ